MVAESDLAVYGATKAALISLCESITVGEGDLGVTATAVSPGYVDTDMTRWIRDRVDPGEMTSVEDIAGICQAVWRLSRHAYVPNVIVTRPGSSIWRP